MLICLWTGRHFNRLLNYGAFADSTAGSGRNGVKTGTFDSIDTRGLPKFPATLLRNPALHGDVTRTFRLNWWRVAALLAIDNEAVYLQPFLGFIYVPNDRFFARCFVQYDLAANGNSVALNTGTALTSAGVLTDPNHVSFDLGYLRTGARDLRGMVSITQGFACYSSSST